MKRGKLVTFEGGDGAGKTTLIARLVVALKREGIDPLVTREPGATPLGESLRSTLLNHRYEIAPKAELLLFLAGRAQHLHDILLPAMEEGRTVLCDRFNDSTIAYQGAGRELGVPFVQRLCDEVCGDLPPSLTFYLDIDPTIGKQRLTTTHDRLEKEEIAFHERVRQGFLTLTKQFPDRIHLIDATQTPEEVFNTALPTLLGELK